jgi:energy-coupling factor transporter transmembrane protein EcfT
MPWKTLGAVGLAALAVTARDAPSIAAVALVNGIAWRLGRLPFSALWRDVRWLLLQGALVVVVYALRDGAQGFVAGLQVAARIVLFVVPAALILRTTELSAAMRDLRRWLPRELGFIAYASLRYVPFFARELKEIADAQRLRGVAASPRALLRPRSWPELYRAVAVPLVVRAVKVSGEAALAAEARGLRLGPEPEFPQGIRISRQDQGRGDTARQEEIR